MGNLFTPEELQALEEARKPPEGYEPIPNEHRARYCIMAVEQLAMVLTTIPSIIFQVGREGEGFLLDNGKIEGCAAGLQRAVWFLRGFRNRGTIGKTDIKNETVANVEVDTPKPSE
jgi:hypothetical protein